MTPTLALVIAGISALASLTAIATFLGNRRKAAMDEGRRQQVVEQLRCDLEQANAKIHDLEARLGDASGDMRELKTDVKHILDAIKSMETKLDRHIEVKP